MLGGLLGVAGRVAAGSAGAAVGLVSTVVSEAVGVATAAVAPGVSAAPEAPDRDGRVHVAVPGVRRPNAEAAARRLERLLSAHAGVRRAEVNAVLGRVLLCYDPDRWTPAALGRLVAEAERECGLGERAWPPAADPYPAHPGALLRAAVGLGLNLAGLGYSVLGRALPVPALGLVPPALSLVDVVPRLRAALEAAVGHSTADAVVSVSAAAAHTATRQPLALLCDAGLRYSVYQEAAARCRSWWEWDSMLADREGAHRAAAAAGPPRPVALPDGPVERVAHRSAMLGVGGTGAVGLLAGRRMDAALAAGVAKAAAPPRSTPDNCC